MNSVKINLNHIIGGFLTLLVFSLLIFVGKTIAQSVQTALSLDEQLDSSAAPQLNKQNINKAIEKIGTYKVEYEPKSEIKEGEEVKGEDKNKTWPKSVLITNSSGIDGAAGDVSQLFDQDGTDIKLETGETLLDETVLLYKNEYKDLIADWQKQLTEKGWTAKTESASDDGQYDVELTLGQK